MNAKSPAPPVGHPVVLPRRLRLPPHRSLLLRGPSARLVGLDPRTALVVDDLPPPLAQMLDELAVPTERVGLLARAVQRGAHRDAAEELLRQLVDADVLVDADEPDRVARQRAAAARHRGGRRTGRGRDRHRARTRRRRQRVDRRADADGAVQEGDLGTGLLDGDRGRSAVEAVVDVVRRVAPGTSAGRPPARAAPDLCVLADAVVPEPARLAALHRDRVAHLPVRLRDGTGIVGPLVLPGRSACLGCVELHGAPSTPAGRPSRRSSSGDPAAAVPPRRRQPRRWGSPRRWWHWTSRAAAGRRLHRCSAPLWSSISPRASCFAARGRRTRTARVAHHRPRRHASRATNGGQS